MNILAIETATTSCAVALRANGHDEVLILDEHRRHTEVLTGGIARILRDADLTVASLQRIVVDQGPGLFTGLRVGLAAAQSLAHGLGVELVGVTSLELLAHGAKRDGVRGAVVALVDARRGELFAQLFDVGDEVRAVDDPHVATPSDVVAFVGARDRAFTLTGDGAARYRDDFASLDVVTVHPTVTPPALEALALGGVRAASAHVAPLYLREADAVANFTTRQRPQ